MEIGGSEFVLAISGGGGGGLLDASSSTITQRNVNYKIVLATKRMGSDYFYKYLQTFWSNKFEIYNSNCLVALIFRIM